MIGLCLTAAGISSRSAFGQNDVLPSNSETTPRARLDPPQHRSATQKLLPAPDAASVCRARDCPDSTSSPWPCSCRAQRVHKARHLTAGVLVQQGRAIARRAQIGPVLIVARRGGSPVANVVKTECGVVGPLLVCRHANIAWPESPGPAHHSCRASTNHCQCDPRPLVGGVVGVGEGDQGRRGTRPSRRNRIQPVQVIVLLGRRHAPGTVVGEANLAHQRRVRNVGIRGAASARAHRLQPGGRVVGVNPAGQRTAVAPHHHVRPPSQWHDTIDRSLPSFN